MSILRLGKREIYVIIHIYANLQYRSTSIVIKSRLNIFSIEIWKFTLYLVELSDMILNISTEPVSLLCFADRSVS